MAKREKKELKLYLLKWASRTSKWDVYTSAVVAAYDADEARMTHPAGGKIDEVDCVYVASWATSPDDIGVKCIGFACEDIKPGVVISSYRAG